MGLCSFRWRLFYIAIAIILIWQSSKIWVAFTQDVTEEHTASRSVTVKAEDNAKEIVHITVYYEALCPDSRSFFIKQLLPTYMKIKENLEIKHIPYGKATTTKVNNVYEFKCQHGPIECQANMMHACAIDVIKDQSVLLNFLSCMIKNNMEPINIMNTCAQKMNVDQNSIIKCYSGVKGKELLAGYGELTSALRPQISFIPTVSINNSTKDQAKVLKNLLQEVCLIFKVKPEGCM